MRTPTRSGAAALALLAGLALTSTAARAASHRYAIDPVHTRIWFEVQHLGFSKAMGSFRAPQGWIELDLDQPETARAEVSWSLDTLDLGDEKWNRRLHRKDGFNVDMHPKASFSTDRVEVIDADHWRLHGSLTLRGVSAPVVLETTFNRSARHPLTLRRTVGFSAHATLDRTHWGLDAWPSMVGREVSVRIELEATRARRSKTAGADPATIPNAPKEPSR